jgi:hypothetical protein
MEPFRLISQYFWLLCLVMSLFNYLTARRRLNTSRASAAQSQEASRYLRWFALAGALPWVLMGLGQISGFTPTVWYYFRPQDFNPYVVAWFTCIFLLTIFYAVWTVAMGGAAKIREFELLSAFGMKSSTPMSEGFIKLVAAVGPLFIVLWIWIVTTNNVPLPR